MREIQITNDDLVLQVSPSYDPRRFNFLKYESFIDLLCGSREYQKEAIKRTCIFLLWGNYPNLKALAEENYRSNQFLQTKWGRLEKFLEQIQLKDKLSCSIDLATGSGKSFIIYGVAQILLSEGVIDKVLVLCPSTTIEDGLTKKFRELSANSELKALLPPDAAYKNPRIIQAVETIGEGDICIENIHSTYKNTKSAIGDSLLWNGDRVLVLNDEAHHIYSNPNREDIALKKWFEFLSDKDFGFKYIVGFTGTPYIENEYFSDVIYRYSLTDGINEKFIKNVEYIKDADAKIDSDTRIQLILQNHAENRKKYPKIKPITIFVSKDIKHCETDREYLIEEITKSEKLTREEAEKRVIIITSKEEHKKEFGEIFKTVNEKDNPVEWICSVAMLTEGWDVPNVFQIVPSEEKAFNSKLLISQVVGRGLRIPAEYAGENLSVIVLNHIKFGDNIVHLVDEVLERDEKIYAYPIQEKSERAFVIYNLIYDDSQYEEIKEHYIQKSFKDMLENGITLPSKSEFSDISITYSGLKDSEDEGKVKTYTVKNQLRSIEDVANEIAAKIANWGLELESKGVNTDHLDQFDFPTVEKIIRKSLKKRGLEVLTKDQALICIQSFGPINRFGSKNVRYKKEPKELELLNIFNIGKSGTSIDSIRKGKTSIFFDENSEKYGEQDDRDAIKLILWEVGPNYYHRIANSFLFKTPFNIAIAASEPEKKFLKELVDAKNEPFIQGFFKSKDRGFYHFSYSWMKGEHSKTDNFNPDFFISLGKTILVIEIKGNETSKEYSMDYIKNRAKYFQAKEHFRRLNEFLEKAGIEQRYVFHFCSPSDFKILFRCIRENLIENFLSGVEASFEDTEKRDRAIKEMKDEEMKISMSDVDLRRLALFDSAELEKTFGIQWDSLEETSKIFLLTAEKDYQDNKDTEKHSFLGVEIIKAFEFELKSRLFQQIQEDEDLSSKVIEIEERKSDASRQNKKAIDYFNLANDFLDLGAMEALLKYNSAVGDVIRQYTTDPDFLLQSSSKNAISSKDDADKVNDQSYLNDFPNFISLLRNKYRNKNSHGDKIMTREEFERVRDLLLFGGKMFPKMLGALKAN